MIRRAVVALLAISGVASDAQACSCVRNSLEQALQQAEVVMAVEIRAVEHVPLDRQEPRPWSQRATYVLKERLKGNPDAIPELFAGVGGGDCGTPLIVGFDYLLLLKTDGEINYCSGFFGPYHDWDESHLPRGAHPQAAPFARSLRRSLVAGGPVCRPPPTYFGFEDSSSRWFGPPPPPDAESGASPTDVTEDCAR